MAEDNAIISIVVDETTGRLTSIHRVSDEPKVVDENSIVRLSKSDIARIMEMAENIPGVGNISYEK